MAQPPRPGDSHGNLLWKITENTFEGGGLGGAVAVGTAIGGSTPDRVLQTGPLGLLESGAVTTTELGFLAGATSNIQVQINALSGGVPGIESLADATAIWLTAAERVGIGTSAPDSLLVVNHNTVTLPAVTLTDGFTGGIIDPLLHLGGANSQQGALIIDGYAANGGLLIGRRSQGTAAAPTAIDIAGRNLIAFMTSGFDGSVWSAPVNLWTASSDGAWTTTSHPTRLRFWTVPAGTVSPPVERMWIGSNGFVGIGINAPDGLLHVRSGSSGVATPDTFADDFVIENSTFVGMTLMCPNNTVATIAFADPQDSDVGSLNYNHSLNVLSIRVNALEYVYLNGTQVGIGIGTPDGRLHSFSGSAGAVTANLFADELVLENNDHGGLTILTPSGFVGCIFFGDESDNDVGQISYNHSLDTLTLTAGTVNVVNCISTACNPGSDNAISLGNAGNRWTEVFAVAPIINTSDAREKNSISGVSLNLALDLLDKITPRSYVWNNTRILGTHYGFVAQEIESAARAAGLVPGDFGPLHYDRENDRYGLRESELLPFLWRVVQDQQKRIQTLEYAYGH